MCQKVTPGAPLDDAVQRPRWSPQKRPYEVTSKPAIAIGRRRDCFLPCLGVSMQVAIVAVWVGTYVQMSLAAKNGAILGGLWRCFLWPHAATSGICPRSGPDDSLFGLSEALLGQFRRNCAPGRAGLVITYFPHISNGISGEFPGRVLSLSGASAPVVNLHVHISFSLAFPDNP